jgi:sigma54-dependent transcription regulator
MLDNLKGKIKGAVTGAATKVAAKVAQTSWGMDMLKKEIEKLPMPPQAKQMFLKLIETRPDLLQKIAEETQELMNQGKNQMAASQAVMMKYQNEIRDALLGK